MRTANFIIFTVLSLPLSTSTHAQEVSKDVLDRIRSVSVSIEVDGQLAGSGTLFEKDGETWCLTAQHVIAGARSVRVTQHHTKLVSLVAEVFRQDDQCDVALLKLGLGIFKPETRFHKGKLPLDTAVIHCGSMAGHHHTVTRGYLIGHDRVFRHGVLRDLGDFTGYFGSSGGGVFTSDGRYIGMVIGGIQARLVYIVPIRAMEEVLK